MAPHLYIALQAMLIACAAPEEEALS